jgi:hypothetical protein
MEAKAETVRPAADLQALILDGKFSRVEILGRAEQLIAAIRAEDSIRTADLVPALTTSRIEAILRQMSGEAKEMNLDQAQVRSQLEAIRQFVAELEAQASRMRSFSNLLDSLQDVTFLGNYFKLSEISVRDKAWTLRFTRA